MSEFLKLLPPAVVTLVAVGIGWLLNELGQHFRFRRDDKRDISRAISYLLEIHHFSYKMNKVIELMKQQGLPDEVISAAVKKIPHMFSHLSDLPRRYNDAVDAVSAANPIIGFQLRAQDVLLPLATTIDAVTASEECPEDLKTMLNSLSRYSVGYLEYFILRLSRRYRLRTWIYLKYYFWRKGKLIPTDDIEQMMGNLKVILERAQSDEGHAR